jgi:hypothetical protein
MVFLALAFGRHGLVSRRSPDAHRTREQTPTIESKNCSLELVSKQDTEQPSNRYSSELASKRYQILSERYVSANDAAPHVSVSGQLSYHPKQCRTELF